MFSRFKMSKLMLENEKSLIRSIIAKGNTEICENMNTK